MVVRRNESRRRRVGVAGETAGIDAESVAPSTPPKRKKASDKRAYSFGADRRNQLKTTDLMPKRFLSFSLVVLVLLASIGLLNLLASYAGSWEEQIGKQQVAALSLSGRGTLASWFSSFLLIITGLASLQIYALRQHRRDDYRGTYRLWIWMSALLMMASLNCVVDLASIASNLVASLTSFSFQGKSWLPVTIKLVVLSSLIARGLYEVRASRGAFALVVIVWVAYSTAAIIQLPVARPALVSLGSEVTLGNCLLFGTAGLLMAELVYARFIYLHAHGLIKQRVAKPKSAKKVEQKPKTKTKPKAKSTTTTKKQKTSNAKKTAAPAKSRSSKKSTATEVRGNSKTAKSSKTAGGRKSKSANTAEEPAASKMSKLVKARKSKRDQELAEMQADDNQDIIKLSKSEIRRRRKAEKRRRAA